MNTTECLLTTLPGASEEDRLAVVLLRCADGSSKISLRQQSWADGLGWYDQKSLDLEPQQLRQLRTVLGWGGRARSDASSRPATLPFPGVQTESA